MIVYIIYTQRANSDSRGGRFYLKDYFKELSLKYECILKAYESPRSHYREKRKKYSIYVHSRTMRDTSYAGLMNGATCLSIILHSVCYTNNKWEQNTGNNDRI